jgi:hypothetical protein
MIKSVGDLIERLRLEASELEECGSVDLACGISAAVRVISDELGPFDAIGGDVASDEPPAIDHALIDELTALKAENATLKAQGAAVMAQSATIEAEYAALVVRHGHLMSCAGAVEEGRQAMVEAAHTHMMSLPVYSDVQKLATKIEADIRLLPMCKTCRGSGVVKPMFHEFECDRCVGSGRDLSEPLELIVGQQKLIGEAKAIQAVMLKHIYTHGISQAEKEAMSVTEFYRGSKTNMRGD